jgi:hypothetical protein
MRRLATRQLRGASTELRPRQVSELDRRRVRKQVTFLPVGFSKDDTSGGDR